MTSTGDLLATATAALAQASPAPLARLTDGELMAHLAEVARGIREKHPEASWMSAGMSGDLEAAVAHGATHLRVGSAILGSRQSHR